MGQLRAWLSSVRAKLATLPHRAKVVIGVLGLLALTFVVWLVSFLVFPAPSIRVGSSNLVGLGDKLEIRFNLPVSRRSINFELTPDVVGSWSWQGGAISPRLVFEPSESWPENQSFAVELSGIVGAFGAGDRREAMLQFTTAAAPVIVGASFSDGQVIESAESLNLKLDQINDNLAEFSAKVEPAAEVETVLSADKKTIEIRPKQPFIRGQIYTLIVEREVLVYSKVEQAVVRRGEKQEVLRRNFSLKPPPQITSFTPQGTGVLPVIDKLTAVFDQPMNQGEVEQNFSLSPPVNGDFVWVNDKTLEYRLAERLGKALSYKAVILAGTHTASGDTLETEANFSFSTVGAVKIISAKPGNGAAVSSSIQLTFDQPVDKSSAESRWQIEPAVNGEFSWQGNTLIFRPSSLSYYQIYKVSLASGVVGLYGDPSVTTLTHQFTTEEQTVVLNARYDRQDRALSCELAALKMALSYKGVAVGENELLDLIGYDSSPRQGNVWADPDVVFVGNIDGSQNSTGYGVHWLPIAKAGSKFRATKAVSGWNTVELAREIEKGNPVVVWGVTGRAYYDPWVTTTGKTVAAWKGEHARTAIGFKGSSENPSSIILLDPLVGKITWSRKTFEQNWGTFSNSGVIIY